MRLIGYARVSDKEQAKTGYSIEAQTEAIEVWASEQGHTISRVFTEIKSSSKPSQETRPTFEQAVKLVLAGAADGLVIKWMDRFARNVEDYLRVRSQFFQAGKNLISISEPLLNGDPSDPVARYLATAIMAAYQLQAELSGLKAAQGRERRAKQGQYPGAVPLGYERVDRQIKRSETTGQQLQEAFIAFSTGKFTLETWGQEAELRGVVAQRGGVISKSGWQRIFRNPFYAGRYTWKGVEYLGDYEPLVSEDVFNTVQEILDAGRPADGQQKHFWLLSGLLWSDVHHRLMVGTLIKGEFRYYRATGPGSEHNIKADDIEGRVINLLGDIKWSGENKYHVPEQWRLALRVSANVGQLWQFLVSDHERREFLRLIFFEKGVRVSSGGSIVKVDLLPGFKSG
jgi:DNA invertase Pin-like site-specific DNA recombinase